MFEGVLRDAPFAAESFDVVYMRNVLSHLASPLEEFNIIHRLLKPSGYLIFETGNVAELPPETAGELELPDHLFHFSEATIRKLLERSGFDWIDTRRSVLLKHLPAIKMLRLASQRNRAEPPEPAIARQLTLQLPKSRLAKRLRKQFSQFLRYDVGQFLPANGHRCTLEIVARKPTV